MVVFWSIFGVVVVVVLGVIGFIISIYNNLVTLKNYAFNAFAQIDVQLKRRYDLIPNIVEIAKKYLSHEQETLSKVIQARNTAKNALDGVATNNPDAIAHLNEAEKSLKNALMNFNMTMEAYPDLKANTTMMQLSEELTTTENKVAFARQAYNDNVTSFNIYKQAFPNNIIARFFAKFSQDLDLLDFDNEREVLSQAPKVQF